MTDALWLKQFGDQSSDPPILKPDTHPVVRRFSRHPHSCQAPGYGHSFLFDFIDLAKF